MMREGTSPLIRRADYTAPAYWIKTVDLSFDLDPAKTMVINRMLVVRNADVEPQPLRPTCMRLMTMVLAGSRSKLRSTVLIQ